MCLGWTFKPCLHHWCQGYELSTNYAKNQRCNSAAVENISIALNYLNHAKKSHIHLLNDISHMQIVARPKGLSIYSRCRGRNLPSNRIQTGYKWLRRRNLRVWDRPRSHKKGRKKAAIVIRFSTSSCHLVGVFIPPISLSRRSRSGTDWFSWWFLLAVTFTNLCETPEYIVDASSTLTAYWPIIDYCCCSSICLHFSLMSCCICLEDLNSPVSLPCGVYIMVTFASPFVDNLNRAYFLLWMSQESCSGDSTLFDPSCMSNMSHTLFYRYISATLLAILRVQRVL